MVGSDGLEPPISEDGGVTVRCDTITRTTQMVEKRRLELRTPALSEQSSSIDILLDTW